MNELPARKKSDLVRLSSALIRSTCRFLSLVSPAFAPPQPVVYNNQKKSLFSIAKSMFRDLQ
jgi:hypothetical protein